ncbi:MAG: hypothetical protein ACO258_12540 [Burkholderiaceae bacterium]|jgi:hypothetical protein
MLLVTGTLAAALLALAAPSQAQSTRIYRCGNEYTNNPQDAQLRGCKPIDGGNVTIIEAPRPAPQAAPRTGSAAATSPAGSPRVESAEQRARDAEARTILEAELRKAEVRLTELQKEYNNGEPEKVGPEFRNHQKYLDRVAELKAAISRTESDIAGIRREIARLPPRS